MSDSDFMPPPQQRLADLRRQEVPERRAAEALVAQSGVRERWRRLTLDQRRPNSPASLKTVILKPATRRGAGFHPEFVAVVFRPLDEPQEPRAA